MAKRPSVTQIRARQIKLLRYQLTTGKSDAQVARDFGISSDTVRRVKNATPRQLRKSWNRSPDLRTAYSEVGPVSGKGSTKAKGVRLIDTPHTSKQRIRVLRSNLPSPEKQRRIDYGDLIGQKFYAAPTAKRRSGRYNDAPAPDYGSDRFYPVADNEYWRDYTGAVGWRFYTESHGWPQSYNDLRTMYYEGYIDDDQWDEIDEVWREMYGIK